MPATRSSTPRLCLGAALLWLSNTCDASAQPDLRQYVDRNRVLLVFAPSADDPSLLSQERMLAGAAAGTGERDLVLVPALGADAAELRQRYRIADGAFAAILVGKDGGTKLRSAQPLAARTLFLTIDAMPMRRAERRR